MTDPLEPLGQLSAPVSPAAPAPVEERAADDALTYTELARRLNAMEGLAFRLIHARNTAEVVQIAAEQGQLAFNATFSAVYRIRENWIEYAGGVRAPKIHHRRECLAEDGLLRRLIREKHTLYLPELDAETEKHLWRSSLRQQNIRSLLIAPLSSPGLADGVCYLGFQSPIRFGEEDERLLYAIIECTRSALLHFYTLQQLEQSSREHELEISLLYDLASLTSSATNLRELLKQSLERILRAVGCETGQIYLPQDTPSPEEMIFVWPQTGIPEPIKQYLVKEGRLKQIKPVKGPYLLENLDQDGAVTCLTVPIPNKARRNYQLRLFAETDHLSRPATIHLVTHSAQQLGLVIEGAQQIRLAEESLLLEERQRLARNLHDSITQSLWALTLTSDVALKAFDRQDANRLRELLTRITSTSLQALKEMRLMLFELRPIALQNMSLVEALTLRLDTVERRSGMEASLDCPADLRLPEALEVELYHIICEALNNSLRHSGAQSVRVAIKAHPSLLTIEVQDNGKGFDPASVHKGGLGLTSMSERTRKLDGSFSIASEEGKGTRIQLKIRIQKD